MGLSNDPHFVSQHDGRKISRPADAADFDETAGPEGKDGPHRNGNKDTSRLVTNEEGAVPRIDVGIVIGNDRAEMDGKVASSVFWRKVVHRLRRGESRQRLPGFSWELGAGRQAGSNQRDPRNNVALDPHPIPPFETRGVSRTKATDQITRTTAPTA
jgi:hypothetical protein